MSDVYFSLGLFTGMAICIAFACGCLVVREVLIWKRVASAVDSYAKSAERCAKRVCGTLDRMSSDIKEDSAHMKRISMGITPSRPNAKKAHGGWKRQKRHANGRFGGKK